TAACVVTTTNPSATHVYASLQQAINAEPNGTTFTVNGKCAEHPLVFGRSNLIIQGVPPASCGTAGPTISDLTSTVQGLDIVGSSGIVVQYLNLVDSTTNGLLVSASSIVPVLTCNCAARNAQSGIAVNTAAVNGASKTL